VYNPVYDNPEKDIGLISQLGKRASFKHGLGFFLQCVINI
jgi:hypothetical protein